MNPIRLVSGAITLPAHAAAAVIGASVGVATTGARTTARVVEWAVGRATGPSPQQSPWASGADAPAGNAPVADVPVVREVVEPATRTRATKKASASKAPAKKAPARRKAPSRKAAVVAPALGLTEAEAQDVLRTPSGIPAAGDGINPDTTETDLHQPGTEPLMDPATVKAVASESEMLRRAADTDKG